MKLNTALAVFLLLVEPGSPFFTGAPAISHNLKRPRSFLSASLDKSGLVNAYTQFSKYKKVKGSPAEIDVDVPDAPTEIVTSTPASLGIPEIPDYVPAPDVAAPKASVVDGFVNAARGNYESARTSIVDSPRSPGEVPNLGGYLENNVGALKGSIESTATTTYVPGGKVPTLAQFFQEKMTGTGSMAANGAGDGHVDGLTNINEKLGLMFDNAMSGFSGSDMNLPSLPSVPEGSAGWAVAGFAILIAAGQRRTGVADDSTEMQGMVMSEDNALEKLSADMKLMAEEIKKLTAATDDIRKELYQSKEKLAQKELQISKEKLKTMEKEAKLMQEIQKKETLLKEGDRKVALLVQELAQTIEVRGQLSEAMDKVKEMEAELRKARGEPEPEKEIEVVTKPSVTIIEPDLLAILEERAKMGNAKAPAKKRVVKGEKTPVDKAKVSVKKTAPKGATKKTAKVVKGSAAKSSKEPEQKTANVVKVSTAKAEKEPEQKTVNVVKGSTAKAEKEPEQKTVNVVKGSTAKAEKEPEPFFLKDAEPKQVKPTPKVSKKPAQEAEAAPGNFRSLSKATLSRKTVKQLMEFLEAQGAITTGDDGKPLKKAVLVESVQSI